MFSTQDVTPIDYFKGNFWNVEDVVHAKPLRERKANNLLMASFITIRRNCEEACSQKMLNDVSEDIKDDCKKNSRISQITLKSNNDELQKGFDACIRRCFGNLK